MKRIMSLIICITIVLGLITACDEKENKKNEENSEKNNSHEMITVWVPSFVDYGDYTAKFYYDDFCLDKVIYEYTFGSVEYLFSYNRNKHLTEVRIKTSDYEYSEYSFTYQYTDSSVTTLIDDHTFFVAQYDDMRRALRYDLDGFIEEFKYDSLGRMICIDCYYGGQKQRGIQYFYDGYSRRIISQNYDGIEISATTSYKYDEKGRVLEEKMEFGDGRISTTVYAFDDTKGTMEMKMYDEQGLVSLDGYTFCKMKLTPEEYEVLKVNSFHTSSAELYIYEEQSGLID